MPFLFTNFCALQLVFLSITTWTEAFAQPREDAPLPAPSAQTQSTISLLKGKTLGSYFTIAPKTLDTRTTRSISKLDPEQEKLFEAELDLFLTATDEIGFPDTSFLSKKEFSAWWQKNRAGLLTGDQMREWASVSIEVFVSMIWLRALGEKAKAENREEDMAESIAITTTNTQAAIALPIGTAVLAGVLWSAGKVGNFVLNTIHGAIVAGPVASLLQAYVDSTIRSLREYFVVKGNKHFGGLSVRLSKFFGARLMTEQQVEQKGTELLNLIETTQHRADQITRATLPDMSPDQYADNMRTLSANWVDAMQIWLATFTPSAQGGRNILTDALFFRQRDFAIPLATFEIKMELFSQGLHSLTRELMARHPNPAEVEALIEHLLAISTEAHDLETNGKSDGNAETVNRLQEAKDALSKFGARTRDVEELLKKQKTANIARDQMVATLAAQMFHDLEFPELNRGLPPSVQEGFQAMQRHYGFSFYEKMLRPQVQKVLRDMGLRVGNVVASAEERIPVLQAAHNSITENQKPTIIQPTKAKRMPRDWAWVGGNCRRLLQSVNLL